MAIHVRELTNVEQTKIEQLTRSRTAPVRLVRRAWIIKLSADGEGVTGISEQVDLGKDVVRHWIHCFNADGLAGLDDAPRSGRPYTYDEAERSKVIAKARSVPPKPDGDDVPPTCHWTLDQLQRELNKEGMAIKRSQIRRILKAEHIKWQKPRTWLESDDPQFAEKKGAIVALYTDPPEGSVVVNIDELGPVAAKSYPAPSWSDEAHRPHFRPDYSRHGDLWVYGALIHREGNVFIETPDARNTASWLHFLDGLEGFVPEGDVYLIVDALPLHWTMDTMLWNWGHPRFHFVPVPKAAAWLNLIEGFWKILRERSIAGRDFQDTVQLAAAMQAGVADWDEHPTPFLWGREPRPKRHLKRTYVYRI